MSERVKFQAFSPKDIEFTLSATLTMADWLAVKETIEKAGAPTTYGPTGWLHSAICSMASRAWNTISEEKE